MKSREQKQAEAMERNANWESLSLRQKLDSLKGRGAAHCKQYKKLLKELISDRIPERDGDEGKIVSGFSKKGSKSKTYSKR